MDQLAEKHARGESDDDECGIQIEEDDCDQKQEPLKQRGEPAAKKEVVPEIQFDVG